MTCMHEPMPTTFGGHSGHPGPLVAPGPHLASERIARFSRQLMLPGFGELAQRRLAAARVLVVGAGGLGSAVVPSLAGAGVGTIGIADDDLVELSNLHRQTSHGVADLGHPKVDSLAETVAAIDPECRVVRHGERLTAENIADILSRYDLIVDGSDNFPTRYLTNDAAALAGVPLVWGAILRYHGQIGVAWHEHGPGYRDLFPVPPSPDEVLSCELGGVLPSVCATVGALMATEVVKVITGVGEPLLGRVTTLDALTGRSREIAYTVIADAPAITRLIDYERFCGFDPVEQQATDAATIPAVTAAELLERLRDGTAVTLIDVREPAETELGRIHDSVLLPLGELLEGAGPEPGVHPVVVYCERDPRSRRAARVLSERGHTDVAFLAGGIASFAAVAGDLVHR